VGKTPQEAAQIANQLYGVALQQSGTGAPANVQSNTMAPQPQQQQFAPQPAVPQQLTEPTQDDWSADPYGAAQRYTKYIEQSKLQPVFDQYNSLIGQQSVSIAQLKYPDEFKRWGPEIVNTLQQLPPDQRTAYAVEKVVGMVKAEHLDELVTERVEVEKQKIMENPTLLRPGTSQATGATADSGIDFDSEELPENFKRVLARHRVTPEKLDEFLLGQGGSLFPGATLEEKRKKWFEAATKGDIITEERFGA
jgi:hypothetical protein